MELKENYIVLNLPIKRINKTENYNKLNRERTRSLSFKNKWQ